jgi:membrane protein implicated in regulation of membrane protease activity
MRTPLPAFRHVLSLTVLAGVGMAGLLTPWPWVQVLTVALVAVIALLMVARNALRRASRRIDTILEEELGTETDADPAPAVHRLAS